MKSIIKRNLILLLCNFILFFIVNIKFLRVFHPVSVFIMAITLLIGVFANIKKEYVKWQKKAPSIVPSIVIFDLWVLCAIIEKFALLTEILFVVVFLIKIFCGILAIIAFLRYMIVYNKAYRVHRKELKLTKQQRLMNASMPVLLFLGIFLVWIITVSYADRVAVVTAPNKYEKEISGTRYLFFPTSIPKEAKNVKFYHRPGFWLASDNTYVEFETTKQFLDEFESSCIQKAAKVTDDNPWIEDSDSCSICTYLEEHYLNQEKCDVYIYEDANSVEGYAINRATNRLFIFYDGRD
ncbi:MAG: hypothetical protein Q4D54_01970 [Eubacteriales bacterium]|nr:hypothetical protein [Eubacteriales bacterium]